MVFETDSRSAMWEEFLALTAELGITVQRGVKFSAQEIARAEWCHLLGTSTNGYPQPESTYRERTYDLTSACPTCWIGTRQAAPFRMKVAPKWGRRSLTQMVWVYDAWFVEPQAYREVFEPFGIGSREVLMRGGSTIGNAVQLVIDEVVALDEYRQAGERCETCEQFKWRVGLTDFAPGPVAPPQGPIAMSEQWYGSGGKAFRATLVRQDLVAAMSAARLKGADLHPCIPRVDPDAWLRLGENG
ncbi:hypothetical protein [Nocardioides lianchengensis]|uniref:Uncharacterized protein n=1 Tax=Nocardioides lianchengensis TaxID=1045774 RepID=A0A1G6MYW5_9ACTN|nr:hypothetical protein [Nocardioides lianchengensis]NYG10596.1 hypothetical protein [Nocardioides lianchengensis]SDC60743.1 hypothetical protein SAMN05421872_10380 [Nocardioides lianchengensis]